MSDPEGTSRKGKRMSFSRLLGNKKDKEPQHSRNASEGLSPPTATSDSAYASSENDMKNSRTRSEETVPVENTGQFKGVSSDRPLGLNKGTGDVVDADTGQVVSTVTTTTTTVSVARTGMPEYTY